MFVLKLRLNLFPQTQKEKHMIYAANNEPIPQITGEPLTWWKTTFIKLIPHADTKQMKVENVPDSNSAENK